MNYRASLALGGSDARLIAKDFDAWLFKRRLLESNTLPPWMEDEPSDAQAFGTAVHMALLEPDRFEKLCVQMPYVESFAKKEGKEVKEQAMALAKERGGFVLRAEQAWALQHMASNFHPVVKSALDALPTTHGEVEKTAMATLHGAPCKGMLDWLVDGTVFDLKTTRDITRTDYTFADERYGVQVAHYAKLVDAKSAGIIWVESVAPFRVRVQRLDAEEFGRQCLAHRMAIETYMDSLTTSL